MCEQRIVMVQTTIGDDDGARALAAGIVEHRLAACVQRLPVQSTYRWKGRIESNNEILLLAKTPVGRAEALVAFIREQHPYELPEILVTPIEGGFGEYIAWVESESADESENR